MHEEIKLNEARYFYSLMLQEINSRENFYFILSAFFSASRSVLQYAFDEAKTKRRGQQWYDNYLTHHIVLSFFRDKRNIIIHEHPLRPAQHITESLTIPIHLSASVTIIHRDANGNVLSQLIPGIPESEVRESDTPPAVTIQYKFGDWNGTDDVLTLSELYLNELRHFVDDGKS
jgi:hypothetical protein